MDKYDPEKGADSTNTNTNRNENNIFIDTNGIYGSLVAGMFAPEGEMRNYYGLLIVDNNGYVEQTYNAPEPNTERWQFEEVAINQFQIKNVATERYIGLAEESTDNYVPIVTLPEANGTTQWRLYYPLFSPVPPFPVWAQFVNMYSGKAISIPGNPQQPGTRLVHYSFQHREPGMNSQIFYLERPFVS